MSSDLRASDTKPEPLVSSRGLKLFVPVLGLQIVDGAVRGFSDLEATASRKSWMKVGFGVRSSGPRRFGAAGLLRR
ncbi:hypothetical protein Bca4012_017421 [Brassica carinata]